VRSRILELCLDVSLWMVFVRRHVGTMEGEVRVVLSYVRWGTMMLMMKRMMLLKVLLRVVEEVVLQRRWKWGLTRTHVSSECKVMGMGIMRIVYASRRHFWAYFLLHIISGRRSRMGRGHTVGSYRFHSLLVSLCAFLLLTFFSFRGPSSFLQHLPIFPHLPT
jgi:hypothetical protein